MSDYLLVAASGSLLFVIHASLKVAFRCIEKAHEHLRESERSRGGAELSGEKAAC